MVRRVLHVQGAKAKKSAKDGLVQSTMDPIDGQWFYERIVNGVYRSEVCFQFFYVSKLQIVLINGPSINLRTVDGVSRSKSASDPTQPNR